MAYFSMPIHPNQYTSLLAKGHQVYVDSANHSSPHPNRAAMPGALEIIGLGVGVIGVILALNSWRRCSGSDGYYHTSLYKVGDVSFYGRSLARAVAGAGRCPPRPGTSAVRLESSISRAARTPRRPIWDFIHRQGQTIVDCGNAMVGPGDAPRRAPRFLSTSCTRHNPFSSAISLLATTANPLRYLTVISHHPSALPADSPLSSAPVLPRGRPLQRHPRVQLLQESLPP
ncbi:hypothetical protein VTI74DRAFT_4885 [Chaetomium olivicolor]